MRLTAFARTVPRRPFLPTLEELAERTLPSATSFAALPLVNDLTDITHSNPVAGTIAVVSDTVSTAETAIDQTVRGEVVKVGEQMLTDH